MKLNFIARSEGIRNVDSNYIPNSPILHIYYTALTIRDTVNTGKGKELYMYL